MTLNTRDLKRRDGGGSSINSGKAKKSYQKPKVARIRLVPEEAVLTACKAAPASEPGCQGPGNSSFANFS